jgi:hypothetical protein
LHEAKKIEFSTLRLDSFIQKHGLFNVSLLKADAKGKAVLESAGVYLTPNNIKALLVEISFRQFHLEQEPTGKLSN